MCFYTTSQEVDLWQTWHSAVTVLVALASNTRSGGVGHLQLRAQKKVPTLISNTRGWKAESCMNCSCTPITRVEPVQSLPGIAVFQCVKRGVSPPVHLKLPRSSVSERPIQKYFSDLSPVRLIRKACSFLKWKTVVIHNLLPCNINLSGTDRGVTIMLAWPQGNSSSVKFGQNLSRLLSVVKEFGEGQLSPFSWRHLLCSPRSSVKCHKSPLTWDSSCILLFSLSFQIFEVPQTDHLVRTKLSALLAITSEGRHVP